MKVVYYPAARNDLFNIFDSTEQKWGEQQAEKYTRGLYETIKLASLRQKVWRHVLPSDIKDITKNEIFFVSHKSHYVFFRELPEQTGIAILRILHEKMDIPGRLRDSVIEISGDI